jgi:hypothetical protein
VALTSGSYTVRTVKNVVVWPAPDKDGDGPLVWETEVDQQGRQIGQHIAKDRYGNELHSYHAPEGFVNKPGYDHTDNYVKVDDRGQVVRQPNGEAVVIKPGQALVFDPDGSVTVLEDEYAQYVFDQLHDAEDSDKKKAKKSSKTED